MTIRFRLTLFNAATLLITTLAAFGVGGTLFGVYTLRDPYKLAAAPGYEIAYRVATGQVVDSAILNEASNGQIAIQVRDTAGAIVESSDIPARIDMESEPELWQEVVQSGATIERGLEPFGDSESFAVAIPVRSNGRLIAVVESRVSYESYLTQAASDYFYVPIAAAGVLALALVLIFISYILTWRALRPVGRFVKEANKITESDLSRRIPIKTGKRDEFTRLAIAFNKLLDRIQGSMYEREAALAAQRRFVADAGHELRTPLTSIHGYAQMLDEWGLTDEKVTREGIDVIERESKRLRDLAEGLLAVARGDEQFLADMQPDDLRSPVTEAIEAIRPAVREDLNIQWVPGTDAVLAQIDVSKVRQLATILIDNAIKYSPDGGVIAVQLSNAGSMPTLTVRDTGIGIQVDKLPLIFDRFYRADESRGDRGAGLGLAIARQIVEAHGASIQVQSEPGRGTTFIVRFLPPVTTAQVKSGRRRALSAWLMRLRGSDSSVSEP